MPSDGSTPYSVRPPASDLPDAPVPFSWLPDSRRVISAMVFPRPGAHLWLIDTWRGVSRLLTASGSIESDPAVSQNGLTLAFAEQQADYDLYEFSVEHPSASTALATSRSEMDPTSSASGTVMAFTTDRSGREEIWLRSQLGDFERPLVTPGDFGASETFLLSAPAMAPDGQRVVPPHRSRRRSPSDDVGRRRTAGPADHGRSRAGSQGWFPTACGSPSSKATCLTFRRRPTMGGRSTDRPDARGRGPRPKCSPRTTFFSPARNGRPTVRGSHTRVWRLVDRFAGRQIHSRPSRADLLAFAW